MVWFRFLIFNNTTFWIVLQKYFLTTEMVQNAVLLDKLVQVCHLSENV